MEEEDRRLAKTFFATTVPPRHFLEGVMDKITPKIDAHSKSKVHRELVVHAYVSLFNLCGGATASYGDYRHREPVLVAARHYTEKSLHDVLMAPPELDLTVEDSMIAMSWGAPTGGIDPNFGVRIYGKMDSDSVTAKALELTPRRVCYIVPDQALPFEAFSYVADTDDGFVMVRIAEPAVEI
jgi:hypothetical protein